MVVTNWDCNKTVYFNGVGNTTLDTYRTLSRSPKYGMKYFDIFREALDVFEADMDRELYAEKVLSLLGKYNVSCCDFDNAAAKTMRRAKVPKEIKEVIEILEPLPLEEMNFFSNADEKTVKRYIPKVFRLLTRPRTVIRIYATPLEESDDGHFTGNILAPIWNSQRRALKASQLAGNRFSINFGNLLDKPLLNVGSRGYCLTSLGSGWKMGTRENNIIYTNLQHLPSEIRNLSKEILPICKWSVRTNNHNQNRKALKLSKWIGRCGL